MTNYVSINSFTKGPSVAPASYSASALQAHNRVSSYAPAPAPAHGSRYQAEAAPVISVTDDAVIAVAAPAAPVAALPPAAVPSGLCPAPSRLPHQCGGAVNTCWSVGVADVDCPGHSLCW